MRQVDIDIIAVLDRSGSMCDQMEESISQFNEYVREQIEDGVTGTVSLYTFDSEIEKMLSKINITDFVDLDKKDFMVRGLTALNDGVGKAIAESENHGNNLFVIMTDGGENASKSYTGSQVKDMVKEAENRGDEFLFFGAGIDARSAGGQFGMKDQAYINIDNTSAGMRTRSAAMKSVTTSFYASKQGDNNSVHDFDS
jgi:uncharacterized protein YegL